MNIMMDVVMREIDVDEIHFLPSQYNDLHRGNSEAWSASLR